MKQIRKQSRATGRSARNLRYVGGALLLAALLQAQTARSEGLDAKTLLTHLHDHLDLSAQDIELLWLSIATSAPELLTADELAAILSPEALRSLGLDEAAIEELLSHDVGQVLQRLNAAFAPKIKQALDSAAHKIFPNTDIGASAGDAAPGAAGAVVDASAESGGQSSLMAVLGGLGLGGLAAAAGGGGGGGGGSSGGGGATNAAPIAVDDAVSGSEDQAVTFNVLGNDTDANSDALAIIRINGVSIAVGSPVTLAGIGVVSLGSDGQLTFTPLANYNGTPSFTYTVSDGKGGTGTGTVRLTIGAVNDAPVITAPAILTVDGAGPVLVAGISVSDVDAGASLTVVLALGAGQGVLSIGAVPGGAGLSGSGTGEITLTGSPAQITASLAVLTYTPAAGFTGSASLSVSTTDGNLSDTYTVSLDVVPVTSGGLADGYIAGATIFIDVNGNGVWDPGEPKTTTDDTGHFSFATKLTGPIVGFGGTNIDTGLPNTMTLTAPAGSTIVNPLTTIIQGMVASGMSIADATAGLCAALGLPPGVDLTKYDMLAHAGDPFALAAQKAAAQVVVFLNAIGSAGGNLDPAALQAQLIANIVALVKSGAALDLTNPDVLSSLVSNVAGISPDALSAALATAAATNNIISTATDLGGISDIQSQAASNHAPTLDGPLIAVAHAEGSAAFSLNLLSGANDADTADTLALGFITYSIDGAGAVSGLPAGLSIVNGILTVDPNDPAFDHIAAGQSETIILRYAVTDSHGAAVIQTQTITITGTNDAPVVADDSVTIGAGGYALIDVLANDSDIDDDDSLTITQVDGQAISLGNPVTLSFGTVSLTAGGKIEFQSNLGYGGTPSFNYTVRDSLGATSTASVNLDIHPGSTLDIRAGDIGYVVDHAAAIAAAGVDHLDIGGAGSIDAATISDAQASALVAAGLDFAGADTITVSAGAAGTHVSTSLSSLMALGVDAVAPALGQTHLNIDLGGAGGLNTLDAGHLPTFITDGHSDASLDVTLNVSASDLVGVDMSTLAGQLAAAGIDHLDIGGSAYAGAASITDLQSSALVAAGLDFAPNDEITVGAAGTHMATSLRSVEHLAVDTPTDLAVSDKVATFASEHSASLLDGVLDITDADLRQGGDIGHLLGIDLLSGVAQPDLYGQLIQALQDNGVSQILIDATATVTIDDALMASLTDAGMLEVLPVTELVLDATHSGNVVATSLVDMSKLGVDLVELTAPADDKPVYVDLGIVDGKISEAELNDLLRVLDSDNNAKTALFNGASHVALVVDQSTAEVITNTDGAMAKLVELGFSELDVVNATPTFLHDLENAPIEVKLIGTEDDPFVHHVVI
jgi:hypothetical protein